MICDNYYLADILRVCKIKDLIWVMRFYSPLVYRGSYMSAKLKCFIVFIKRIGKTEITFESCQAFYLFFSHKFYKFNNTRTQMLDSIYQITYKKLLKSHLRHKTL